METATEGAGASTELFRNAGFCHCCRSDTEFVAYSAWLRDSYVCGRCMSSPRQRHIQCILDTFFPGWENKVIHESSPASTALSQYCSNYSSSQYLPDVKPGSVVNGVRSENLEALTFENDSIDIFITQDVLEHVFHPDRAIQEVMRVLKSGGFHIFTTPKARNVMETQLRARLEDDGTITHLYEPEYHGNPVGDGESAGHISFRQRFRRSPE
ncbi:MAG: methyltransferase domain-containing protein [Pararobbsia sp.]